MTDLRLWYEAPAQVWTEALPIGNGRLGAMVFGETRRERLQLNEDTLWSGGPYSPVNPEALGHLEHVRELLLAGRYAEAEAEADRWLMARPLKQMPYQPAADLWIEMPDLGAVGKYRRDLDLETAIASTSFTAEGTDIRREVLATAADGIIALRLVTTRRLALRLTLTSPQAGRVHAPVPGVLRFEGHNAAAHGIEGRLAFAVEMRLFADGRIDTHSDSLAVDGASEVTILLDVATSYRRYDDVDADPVARIASRLDAAANLGWTALRARHVADHQALFSRLTIDLGHSPAERLPTDRRIAANSAAPDPALSALYVQYGRYLLLSSSRPGTQPANLQGIWNETPTPPWDSKYTTNINLQMNYWLADPANLGECIEPLLRLLEDVSVTGREVARAHYNAPGWVLHHNTDIWRATAPVDGAKWGLWPTGGAWLCVQLWDHVRFGDDSVLPRIYPLLKGCLEFIRHVLVRLPGTDMLVTAPSLSPENVHPYGAALCYGPAMDSQIIRDLIDAVIEAGARLGRDQDLRIELDGLRRRLPPDRIGHAGQLQEWLEDWDLQAPEIHHRHVSHLYALYPSSQISLERTPALAAAARRSLEIRGDEATGWGIGWRINLWARLGDGERAHAVVQRLLSPDRTYPNMFDAHPPFQIDGNFGGAAGIIEMLVQSQDGDVHLLPALPPAWPAGHVSGVRARRGIEVDVTWEAGDLLEGKLRAGTPTPIVVRYRNVRIDIVATPEGTTVRLADFRREASSR
ncbi:MAG TPA: glycoside hydrolase family 95 protein [Devosia sp.]|nr:glycoside hydrolase family 95 protein [Devosia sp.]